LPRVGSVYTVHNLAYQGLFGAHHLAELGLPPAAMSIHGLEYHGQLSFMKAGLFYSDRITTVSPTYAQEIQTPEQGCGLDGLLRDRRDVLSGILNGVDEAVWNPATDKLIQSRYDANKMAGKAQCRSALQSAFGLELQSTRPLFGVVSRLTEQKGLHLVLAGLDALVAQGGQLVMLGSGEAWMEEAFSAYAQNHPESVAVHLGYDESLAHRIFAASDVTLVPSRFEPCGLTQMYGFKYGSLPLAHRVGGLADTVVDCSLEDMAAQQANGFIFDDFSQVGFERAMRRAFALYARRKDWADVVSHAMRQSRGWQRSAREYVALYQQLIP
jgi:starch synthase